jgi:antitoxin (DNA-binding transcriptional repressor) of toxin-antitoxin stability system
MLFEVDIDELAGRVAEVIRTIDAGYGVLIRREGVVIARLAPEAAFAALEAQAEGDDGLTAEEREARELMEMIQADMDDSF